ncbi:hypothetical protein ACLF6K_13150 [Streptomyces xanthophaeus]|uniref:hypothetical protein n=1 Tax=Streptomyces xanthophaeus TaxID=67385 RepID=UPI003990275F
MRFEAGSEAVLGAVEVVQESDADVLGAARVRRPNAARAAPSAPLCEVRDWHGPLLLIGDGPAEDTAMSRSGTRPAPGPNSAPVPAPSV